MALTIFMSLICGRQLVCVSPCRTLSKRIRPRTCEPCIKNMRWATRCCGMAVRAFKDITSSSGTGIGRWAWSSDSFDFDHDGFPDIYIANGMVSGPSRSDLNSFFWRQVVANSPDQAASSHEYEQGWMAINELIRSDATWSGYERNILYANNRDGTFADVSSAVGLDFIEDSRSFALADVDHDGRLELVLKNRNGPQLRVLKNLAKDLPPSIVFRLQGTKSNPDAVGASVTIESGSRTQTQTVRVGSGFLSQHSKEIFFGLGEHQGPVRAAIHWPSGLVQQLADLPVNHRIWVQEGKQPSRMEPFKNAKPLPCHRRKRQGGGRLLCRPQSRRGFWRRSRPRSSRFQI